MFETVFIILDSDPYQQIEVPYSTLYKHYERIGNTVFWRAHD